MVPGHEIAGVVTAVGANVSKFKVGDHVGVGCFVDSCTTCKTRNVDLEQYMPGLIQTYNGLEADGKTATQGGSRTASSSKKAMCCRFPTTCRWTPRAAAVRRHHPVFALNHWKAGPGKQVAILGMGGLGHMGVKIAHAMGAEVTVLTRPVEARRRPAPGADHYYATNDAERSQNWPARSI